VRDLPIVLDVVLLVGRFRQDEIDQRVSGDQVHPLGQDRLGVDCYVGRDLEHLLDE